MNVRKRMGRAGIGKIFGQEKNITTYNLARMNILLHGVKDSEFETYHGDTLTNDWDMLRETNPAKKPYFDAVVANHLVCRCGLGAFQTFRRVSTVKPRFCHGTLPHHASQYRLT